MTQVIAKEASALGWKPGEVRLTTMIDGHLYLHQHTTHDQEGEVMYHEYIPAKKVDDWCRCQYPEAIVRVFND